MDVNTRIVYGKPLYEFVKRRVNVKPKFDKTEIICYNLEIILKHLGVSMNSYRKIQAIALGVIALILVGAIVAITMNQNPEQIKTEVAVESRPHSIGVSADLEDAWALMFSTKIGVEKTAEEMVAAARAIKSDIDLSDEEDDDMDDDDTALDLVLIENETTATRDSATQKKWAKRVMANVSDYLVIRKSESSSSKALAKMLPDTVVTLVKKGKSWTKVKSGDITGYVFTKYCVFGNDAYNQYKKNCKKYAVVKSDVEALNVRETASIDADVIKTLAAGEKLEYVAETDLSTDWVAVKCDDKTGYVAAEYVTIKRKWSSPVKPEDEKAEQNDDSDKSEAVNEPYEATKSEKKLLAAIIQCEAGYVKDYKGKVAVGAVVLNRVRASRWPNTIKEVIYQKGQFSPASSGALQRVLDKGLSVADCMDAAEDALKGVDPTNGAQSFTYASTGKKGVVIGTVVFY